MADPEFEHQTADLDGLSLHYVTAGTGEDVVVLLHGFPQTWYEWREIIPTLATRYRVVAPDLPGLGDSSRPIDRYDKRSLAGHIWALINGHIGIERFFLVGHDWGGPVGYQIAHQHQSAVRRLVILDVMIPGDGSTLFSTSGGRWHHGFHRTPELPEILVEGRERAYLDYFFNHFGARPGVIGKAAANEYHRTYSQPGAFTAGFNYYRAIPQDVADNERAVAEGKLDMPVLALGGAGGMGRGVLCRQSLERVARDVRGGAIDGVGHWIPEEAPEDLARRLMDFFAED